MTFRPSGPDLLLFTPAHVGPVLQPAKPPVICLMKVFVFRSMTSTDLLFRSVKYMRPLTLSMPLMSKEKLVPDVTFGTDMIALNSGGRALPCSPPPHPERDSAASKG